jgi:polynucleotide 5'-kinase involved in rRNA processing
MSEKSKSQLSQATKTVKRGIDRRLALELLKRKQQSTDRPQKTVICGPEGVGKTTFATRFPGSFLIDLDDQNDAREPDANSDTGQANSAH